MKKPTARSIFGNEVEFKSSQANFRIAAYGIIVNKGKILLVNVKSTGKYFFPGGGVNLGEKLENGLIREIKEETGIDVTVEKFIDFKETFFYYDPHDLYFQNYGFFYLCKALNQEIIINNPDKEDEASEAYWLNLKDLTQDEFQDPGKEIFQKIKESAYSMIV